MKHKVAVGLVTFNREHLLKEAVLASVRQTYGLYKIFVVDNASTDGTQKLLSELQVQFPDLLVVVKNSSNEGSAGGFKLAAEKAYQSGADWVWLMDDDAIPEPDTLTNLLNTAQANDITTGGLGCLVVDENKNIFPPNNQCFIDRSRFDFKAVNLNVSSPVACDTNSFDGFLVHRRAIEACGFPNKSFFTWYDDIDYSLRISTKFKLWVVPNAFIIHKGQLRSEEKSHWPFRAKIPTYEWDSCWRMFYRSRNFYLISRKYSSPLQYHKNFSKHFLKEFLAPVFFKQDHLLHRWRLTAKAALEGYFGVAGKTVDLKPPFKSQSSN